MKNVCVDNLCPCLPQCGIGTMMFGKTMDQSKSNEIIGFSLDNGLNFFDTADSYNNGESERILGNALKGRRDEAIIATKVGYNISGNMSVDLSPAAIRRSVEMSLCNIRTDRIDILYLHAPDYSTPVTHSLREIQHLIDQGKILDWGVSNF